MKRLLLIIALIFFAGHVSFAQEEGIVVEKINTGDQEFDNVSYSYRLAEARIEKYHGVLLKHLTGVDKSKYMASHQAWLKHRELSFAFLDHFAGMKGVKDSTSILLSMKASTLAAKAQELMLMSAFFETITFKVKEEKE